MHKTMHLHSIVPRIIYKLKTENMSLDQGLEKLPKTGRVPPASPRLPSYVTLHELGLLSKQQEQQIPELYLLKCTGVQGS